MVPECPSAPRPDQHSPACRVRSTCGTSCLRPVRDVCGRRARAGLFLCQALSKHLRTPLREGQTPGLTGAGTTQPTRGRPGPRPGRAHSACRPRESTGPGVLGGDTRSRQGGGPGCRAGRPSVHVHRPERRAGTAGAPLGRRAWSPRRRTSIKARSPGRSSLTSGGSTACTPNPPQGRGGGGSGRPGRRHHPTRAHNLPPSS